jgi:predicted transcriptional regulator
MSNTITIDLPDDARQALDRLAQQTGRPIDDLVNQAVRDYLDLQGWQRQKIEAGIAAADRGEFATEQELSRIANKYSLPG